MPVLFFLACNKTVSNEKIPMPEKFSAAEQSMLKTFLESSDYINVYKTILYNYGSVDLEKSIIEYVDGDVKKPLLNLIFLDKNKILALVQVAIFPKDIKNVLPNNSHYAMLLVNYKEYDVLSKNGLIEAYDLNYDNYLSTTFNVENGNIKKSQSFDIPSKILVKYSTLKKKKELGNPIFDNTLARKPAQYELCDANGNGNIGWGECMACMRKACYSSADCAGLCSLIDIGSAVMPGLPGGQCTLSMGASCIYIAAVY